MTRRPAPHVRLLCVLIPCLVPLAACGTVQPITPAGSSPAATRPGVSPLPAPPEPPTGAPPLSSAPTVVLDPGHNGANGSHPAQINRPVPTGRGDTKPCNTTGTATAAGYPESDFTWDVSLRVRDALTARGVQVVLTRPDNNGVGPCVDERAAIANRAGAQAMVSIHADGAARSARGFHVAYSAPPLNASQGPPSIALAEQLAAALRRDGFAAADYIGSGGLDARSDLAGLNLAQVPAALVECANMRNPAEAELVATPSGRARYAAAITEGILAWLTSR
ncbi:MAG TPA: N-acetylmuramoyl-L-alanine amidase [Pseudonocardiaceae bacterium]|nr:N-acetylmuramoyl-L-alanine amidase [Pseudonocardiaceae bacterium]